jgi:hypothetical protein
MATSESAKSIFRRVIDQRQHTTTARVAKQNPWTEEDEMVLEESTQDKHDDSRRRDAATTLIKFLSQTTKTSKDALNELKQKRAASKTPLSAFVGWRRATPSCTYNNKGESKFSADKWINVYTLIILRKKEGEFERSISDCLLIEPDGDVTYSKVPKKRDRIIANKTLYDYFLKVLQPEFEKKHTDAPGQKSRKRDPTELTDAINKKFETKEIWSGREVNGEPFLLELLDYLNEEKVKKVASAEDKGKLTSLNPKGKQEKDNMTMIASTLDQFLKNNESMFAIQRLQNEPKDITNIKEKIQAYIHENIKEVGDVALDNILEISRPLTTSAEGRKSKKGKKAARKASKKAGKKGKKGSKKGKRGKKASKHSRRA